MKSIATETGANGDLQKPKARSQAIEWLRAPC
jgi:hypothetical protein